MDEKSLKQLDVVLDIIRNDDEGKGIYRQLLEDKLKKMGIEFTYPFLTEILIKLQKDDYIATAKRPVTIRGNIYNDVEHFVATFPGIVFIGYQKEFQLKNEERNWRVSVETALVDNGIYLNYGYNIPLRTKEN